MDDHDERISAPNHQRAMTFDELVQLKVDRHLMTQRLRALWRVGNAEMTKDKRKAAQERFNEKADKIASEFGKKTPSQSF